MIGSIFCSFIIWYWKEVDVNCFSNEEETEKRRKLIKKALEEGKKIGYDAGILEGKRNFDDLYNSSVEEKERLEKQKAELENEAIKELENLKHRVEKLEKDGRAKSNV